MSQEFPFEFSSSLAAIAKALAGAQAELGDAKKDAANPAFKRDGSPMKYASLSAVRAAITPVFSKHGLSVAQLNEPHGDGGVCVVTLLMHESGEWIRSKLFVPVVKKDPQGFGSAITYARRYALAAIANIAADEDDDAEAACKPTKPAAAPVPAPAATPASNVDALVQALEAASNAKELAEASLNVSRAKKGLSAADLERCRTAHDGTMRRLEKAA